jgi:hypothetical protein
MSVNCNVQQAKGPSNVDSVYDRVDAPIATGSAHLMRAGAELHLMVADLELNNQRQAALRVASAHAAVLAALREYQTSHALAKELGFYALHNQRLQDPSTGRHRIAETVRPARDLGLVDLDESMLAATGRECATGGYEAAYQHFIDDLTNHAAELAGFVEAAPDRDPVRWTALAWQLVTSFNRVRVRGQVLAIINILGPTQSTQETVPA